MSAVITVEHISKSFESYTRREGVLGSLRDLVWRTPKTVHAVSDISFSVSGGELIGYIGPNGAGKSTSIKMLTGILRPSGGRLDVLGFDPFKERRKYTQHIGVVFGQRTQLWWDIAVIESFKLLGEIYAVPQPLLRSRLKELTEILDIGELLHTPVRKLSLGQRMRCDLAASLIHGPRLLLLDEPTIGLDAIAKDSIRTFLRTINRDLGTTILLTTHDLREIEELCERIIVLDKGKVLFDGKLADVKSIAGLNRRIRIDFSGETSVEALATAVNGRVVFERQSDRRFVGEYDPSAITTADIVRAVLSKFDIAELTIEDPDIEQVIMKLYREGL